MRRWRLGEVAAAVDARPPPNQGQSWPDQELNDITTDSRNIKLGCLFVALRGDRFDGHKFVQAAVRGGAAAVLVDEAGYAEYVECAESAVPILVANDTLHALGDAANMARRQMGELPVVGVTGSNGKTTTKELLAAALSAKGPVHKTESNLNNLIGVPQTQFKYNCHDPAWVAVVEMGMNTPGEIARLAEIAEPSVGLITCVGPAHLEGLGTVEAVARAKCELLEATSVTTAVINADDELLVATAGKVLGQRRVLTFGSRAGSDVRLVDVRPSNHDNNMRVTLGFGNDQEVDTVLPLVGWHNALNAAGAAAAAFALGMKPADIARGLEAVHVPGRRLQIYRNVGIGLNLVDDSYNANPASARAALSTVRDLAGPCEQLGTRVIAVIGDMLELGPTAPKLHREIGLAAAESGMDVVYAVGSLSEHTVDGAQTGGIQARAFSDLDHLQDVLADMLCAGDWVLIKGSRGMGMERLVDWILRGKHRYLALQDPS